jgi:phenylacetate-CoA ligase
VFRRPLYVNEDQFLVEIQQGELLVTTLVREATPLLRYATRIGCEIHRDNCSCGRTTATLVPGGRLDDQVRVNEMPLYEQQIRDVLEHTRAAGHIVKLEISEQRVIVSLEVSNAIFDDVVATLEKVQLEIESEFLARLGIEVHVRLVSPRAAGKCSPG